MPCGLALLAGRGIAAFGLSGIAKAHWHQGNGIGVVESGFVHAQPFAQPVAAVIVPWNAAGVDAGAGGLADDEDAGFGRELHHRTRAEREVLRTKGASRNGAVEVGGGFGADGGYPSTCSARSSQRSSAASFSARAFSMPLEMVAKRAGSAVKSLGSARIASPFSMAVSSSSIRAGRPS